MGKKRRLNKFISKWIKSDLPDDRTTVLLLGVTRIPTSPLASRRPFPPASGALTARRNSSRGADKKGVVVVRRHSSKKTEGRDRVQVRNPASHHQQQNVAEAPSNGLPDKCAEGATDTGKSSDGVEKIQVAMEKSVDSIGTCSLDLERSVDLSSDLSEISSTGTLRSRDLSTPPASFHHQQHPHPHHHHHHLPSYLSLACAVNGYSTSTHYDPSRLLSRSRDVSPHRIDSDHHLTTVDDKGCSATYCLKDNLLSPPNLVPLPGRIKSRSPIMEKAIAMNRHGEFYSSMKTSTFISKETFTAGLFPTIAKDTTDGCMENGHHRIQSKCVSFESKSVTNLNGKTKCVSETSMKQEYTNGSETKSFIQQRVERLYGPGALAQGFFVTTRSPSKKRLSESEDDSKPPANGDRHSKSMQDRLLEDSSPSEPGMRQSTSSPTLPVMRHLRPEFRAQLPAVGGVAKRAGPATGVGAMAKSVTVPELKDEGEGLAGGVVAAKEAVGVAEGGSVGNGSVEKDGHYFLLILEDQTKRLLELAARVENDMLTADLSEDLIGLLRSTSGKARLLVNQKMQQFRGLCTNNINRSAGEAFPTTNEDLQGFWDMVMLQVRQVDALFGDIDELRANGWREVPKTRPKPANNGTAKSRRAVVAPPKARVPTAASEEARRQREAQRKKLIEDRRRAMRESKSQESIEIFVPETS
ncbi:unnamed protein product [Phaedon cochleariae]|uniref:Disks large-associated protein 4 n=1 Tax=Phaedon cochleariae TaxID=80249 RepID=A0A9N9SKK2_PHACE|nr:unnamed protein product [Phaedon cochleariae]